MGRDVRQHWQAIYCRRSPEEWSWSEREARVSLELISQAAASPAARVIDVGGGAATLVDGLLAAGFMNVTVLDIAGAALAQSQRRLGVNASGVRWIEADLLSVELPERAFDIWHDRAVFHFLTEPQDRLRYVEQAHAALRRGGHAIIATFAEDGPATCSGLPVVRYTAVHLAAEFEGFVLVRARREDHVTPWGAHQPFLYCVLRTA